MSMWLGERGSLAFKIGRDGKEIHLRQKRKKAYPERKVLLACMQSAKGDGGQRNTYENIDIRRVDKKNIDIAL